MTPADQEELEHMPLVDAHPDAHRATEPDEDQILRDLYGDEFNLAHPEEA